LRYLNGLYIVVALMVLLISEIQGQAELLPSVVLKGDAGGFINGNEWNSSALKDKINLLLYVDPDKQSWVKPLVDTLNSINYSPDTIGLTYILNTDATLIPNFIIKKKVKQKAKTEKNIYYVLDQHKILVKKWKLKDNSVNVLLFDSSGNNMFTHYGKITQDYLKKIIERINKSINNNLKEI
jgi:uncharacterized protein